jgi:hypothetical protein
MAGTSLFAIRLPSALAGTATVAMVFFVGRRRYGAGVAVMAAALLALHGHHIFWSQGARMWVFITFLCVWSVWLLQSLTDLWRTRHAVLYAAVSTLGLWTEYYYWPFFFAQILWTLFHDADRARPSGILHVQVLALAIAGPALLMLTIQASIQRNYLEPQSSLALLETIELAHLFPRRSLVDNAGRFGIAAFSVLTTLGVVLLLASLAQARAAPPSRDAELEPDRRVFLGLQLAGALVAALVMVMSRPLWGSAKRVAIGCALACVPVVIAWVAGRTWPLWSRVLLAMRAWTVPRLVMSELVLAQVLVPLAALYVLSWLTPVAASRALLVFAPFLLLSMVHGAFRIAQRPMVRGAVCLGLLLLSLGSAYHYRQLPVSPIDYRAIAHSVIARVQRDDLIVVENEWWAQPTHYYLPSDRFRTIEPCALQRRLQTEPPCVTPALMRIWVVVFPAFRAREPIEDRARAMLSDYDVTLRTSALGAHAALFERRADRCGG